MHWLLNLCCFEREIGDIERQTINQFFSSERRKNGYTGYNLLLNCTAEFMNKLHLSVREIINTLGMETGACHLEMRDVKENWKLIEINPRISGAGMNKMIEAAFGFCLVEETLKMALGKPADIKYKYRKHRFLQQLTVSESGYLEKVTGKRRALKSHGVIDVYVKPRRAD